MWISRLLMSAQMWSSFPVTSHLFMSYLVLLPFPCESLGLNLNADQEASLSSPLDNFCFYSSQPLLSLPIRPWGTRPCAPPMLRQCPLSSFSLSSLRCIPLKPASPPVLRSRSLLPYHSVAPASPWLLNRPWFLPPFSVLSFTQSSSDLHNGFCSLPAVAKVPSVPHPQLSLVPHLCFQSSLLSPLPGTARAAGERLFEPL